MKKLVLMFVAIAAITLASCGNKTAQAEGTDTAVVDTTADTTAVDTVATDTTVVE